MALYAGQGNLIIGNAQPDLFGQSRASNIHITAENGSLKIKTPYSPQFVDQLKQRIPATGRKWDAPAKAWFVSAQYAKEVEAICISVYGVTPAMPQVITEAEASFETILRAEYVGNCKSDSNLASVFVNGGWNAKIPEKILRDWFKQSEANAGTLYGLLGCDEKAKPEDIKKAYYRASRQWHPDHCREENAHDKFLEIKSAYDVLSNVETRNKYNAGLFFERMTRTGKQTKFATFTPVLRCGLIRATGKRELGCFIVEEILSWDDITNERGQTMVSFWDQTQHSVLWV